MDSLLFISKITIMTAPLIGGQVIGNDTKNLLRPTLNVHESHYERTVEIITIERLALIGFHNLSDFNLHLLFIVVQQCTYQNRLHHDGYGQVKDYNEMIHNLSLQYQVDIFQYFKS